jgi:hypothetical protein
VPRARAYHLQLKREASLINNMGDNQIYDEFLKSSVGNFDPKYHNISRLYGDSLRVKLSGITAAQRVCHSAIYFPYGEAHFWIYCRGWCTSSLSGNKCLSSVNIKHTRKEVLDKLDDILNLCESIAVAITNTLPQPIAEEIIPHIYLLNEVVGVFLQGY